MTNEDKYQIIIDEVCKHYGVKEHDLMTPSHARVWAEPRCVIFYFGRKLTMLSLATISAKFKRDHSSASHGVKLIENLIRVNGMAKTTTKIAGWIEFRIKQKSEQEAEVIRLNPNVKRCQCCGQIIPG